MKLSIITINYNNCVGLQKTIESVISQAWRDFEWIVIDGGSSDGSKELIEQYQEHFAYWCSEPDKGIYHAMNKGIASAKGEYLNFMNSGDTFYSNLSLQNVFSVSIPKDISVVYGDYIDVCPNGIRIEQRLKDTLNVCDLMYRPINHQSTFIDRKLFLNEGYDETYKLLADWKAFVQWMVKGEKFFHVKTYVACFELGGIHNLQNSVKHLEIERIHSEVIPLYVQDICKELSEKRKVINQFPEIEVVIDICKRSNACRKFLNIVLRICKLVLGKKFYE